MGSKRLFVVIGIAIISLGVWYSFQTFEYVYSRRIQDDGSYRLSSVICGDAPSILFLEEYHPDVPGSATSQDCTRLARTRFGEAILIGIVGGGIGFLGYKYGSEPVKPIDSELPRLPDGVDRTVHGRRRQSP